MNDSIHLLAAGSQRGWSDIDAVVSAEEADWLVKHGEYQVVNQRLLYVILASDVDAALYGGGGSNSA